MTRCMFVLGLYVVSCILITRIVGKRWVVSQAIIDY